MKLKIISILIFEIWIRQETTSSLVRNNETKIIQKSTKIYQNKVNAAMIIRLEINVNKFFSNFLLYRSIFQ